SGAIYNEVLQFFVIVAGLVPLVVIGLHSIGGYAGLKEKVTHTALGANSCHTWAGTAVGHWSNPLGDWIGIVMGLGFVLSFGYWTTNFAEVQRALSAKDLNSAQRTPLIGSFPKIFIPALTIIPGMIALVLVPKLGQVNKAGNATGLAYNYAIPALMNKFLPNGALGIAWPGCSPRSWPGWPPTSARSTRFSPTTSGRPTWLRAVVTATTSRSGASSPSSAS